MNTVSQKSLQESSFSPLRMVAATADQKYESIIRMIINPAYYLCVYEDLKQRGYVTKKN